VLGAFVLLGIFAAGFLHMKHAPRQYYFYFGFPIWFAYSITSDLYTYGPASFANVIEMGKNMPMMVLYIIGMELLVLSFFHRSILTLVMPALALGLVALIKAPKSVMGIALWSAFIPVAIFPLINPIKHANPMLFFVGIAAILAFTVSLAQFKAMKMPYLRMAAIILAAGLVYRADTLFAAKLGLPTANQILAWILLAHSFLTPFLIVPVQDPFERLFTLFLTFAPGYILLSIAYPSFFL
jgi:phosphatidylinositol glycan class N